jgi:prepilin-type N-terminal cleavage/methylation domain-containing protein
VKRTRSRLGDDSGVTLIELIVATVLMAVAGGLTLTALAGYTSGQEHQSQANELVSELRKTGQKAVSEGRTYCVRIDVAASTYTVLRPACAGTGVVTVEGPARLARRTTFSALSASAASPACPTGGCVFFRPRGTATQSSVRLVRAGEPTITVTVEGLTGRVDRS